MFYASQSNENLSKFRLPFTCSHDVIENDINQTHTLPRPVDNWLSEIERKKHDVNETKNQQKGSHRSRGHKLQHLKTHRCCCALVGSAKFSEAKVFSTSLSRLVIVHRKGEERWEKDMATSCDGKKWAFDGISGRDAKSVIFIERVLSQAQHIQYTTSKTQSTEIPNEEFSNILDHDPSV